MTTVERLVECRAEIVVCDFCGHETIESLSAGEKTLDRGTSTGSRHRWLTLWPAHPSSGKDACDKCYKADRFVNADFPPLPNDAVRIRTYTMDKETGEIENLFCDCRRQKNCSTCEGCGFIKEELRPRFGLCLPHRPLDQGDLDHMYESMVIHEDGQRALCLKRNEKHFMPARELPFQLHDDRQFIVTDRWCLTYDPCVFERTKGGWLSHAEVMKNYGTLWADRMIENTEVLELNLRVPVELLQ